MVFKVFMLNARSPPILELPKPEKGKGNLGDSLCGMFLEPGCLSFCSKIMLNLFLIDFN